jgi:hypothetical protein
MRMLITAVVFSTIFLASCYAARIDGPYRGKVIDADTREPIEGVVVLGTWYREIVTPGGAVHNYYDAMETVTDKNGEFEIKGLGLLVMSNVIPMDVLIFKAGYEYESGSWKGLRSRGRRWNENEESYDPTLRTKVKKPVFDFKVKVTYEGDKAIIPLKKLTMEERNTSITFPPSPPIQAAREKIKIMMEEIRKERKERGLD